MSPQLRSLEDNLENRLEVFSVNFVKYFISRLTEEHSVALRELQPKTSNTSKAQLVGKAVGGTVGVTVGIVTGLFGVTAAAQTGVKIGSKLAEKYDVHLGRNNAAAVDGQLGDQLSSGEMITSLKAFLVDVAFEVFAAFEYQLCSVCSNDKTSWTTALTLVAKDAVHRMVGYLYKNSDKKVSMDLLLEGILKGKSDGFMGKGEKLVNNQNDKTWYLGDLFFKPGIMNGNRAFRVKKVYHTRYGFRLPFDFELPLFDDLGYATPLTGNNFDKITFCLCNWPLEKVIASKTTALSKLKDTDDKIDDLYRMSEESHRLLLQEQQVIKERLSVLDKKSDMHDNDAKLRDARILNEIRHQGREMKQLLHKSDGKGLNVHSLGKWWPSQQTVTSQFVPRKSGGSDSKSMLEEIHSRLKKKGRLALLGMGGIGKTTVAKWYSKERGNKYDHIIWLDSEKDTLLNSVKLLADKLFIPLLLNDDSGTAKSKEALLGDIFTTLKRQKILIVFDNLEEVNNDLFSQHKQHFFLMTSRFQSWKQHSNTFDVGLFSEAEATELFRRNVNIEKHVSNPRNVTLLCQKLNYLPLAIAQAAACINQLDITVEEYMKEYEEMAERVLGLEAEGYESSVLTTWKVSIDRIEAGHGTVGTIAIKILNSLSFLNPDRVPKDLFASYSKSKIELNKAVEILKNYSLIKVENGEVSVHRLVQESTKISLEKDKKSTEVLFDLSKVVVEYFSSNYVDNPYMSHLRTVLTFAKTDKQDNLVILQLEEICALVSLSEQDFVSAIKSQERILECYTKLLGPNNRQTMVSNCRRAKTLCNFFEDRKASLVMTDLFERCKSREGEMSKDTIDLQYLQCLEEVHIYSKRDIKELRERKELKEMKDTEKTLQSVLKKQKVHPDFGENHPKTILTKQTLALTFLLLHRTKEAGELLVEVNQQRSGLKDPKRPAGENFVRGTVQDLLQTLYHGKIYKMEYDMVESLYKILAHKPRHLRIIYTEIFGKREEVFGIEIIRLFVGVCNDIIRICDPLVFDEPVELFQLLLRNRSSRYGERSPQAMDTRNWLGLIHGFREDYSTAQHCFDQNLEGPFDVTNTEMVAARILKAYCMDMSSEQNAERWNALLSDVAEHHGSESALTRMLSEFIDSQELDQISLDDRWIFGGGDKVDALKCAVETENDDQFKALMEDLDLTAKYKGQSVLHWIAKLGSVKMLESFACKAGPKMLKQMLNDLDHSGMTPLLCAVENSNEKDVVQMLIDLGSNINVKDLRNLSPLHYAIIKEDEEIVLLLLEQTDLDLMMRTEDEENILHLCASNNMGCAIITPCLIHLKTKLSEEDFLSFINQGDNEGDVPVVLAVLEEKEEIVRTLIEFGGDILAPNMIGATALHHAACKGNLALSEIILSYGADVNAVDEDNETPLHWAASEGTLELVQFLMDNGADFAETSSKLLQEAMDNADERVFALIVETIRGKFPGDEEKVMEMLDQKDEDGTTPLMQAVYKMKNDLVVMLMEAGANVTEIDWQAY